MSVSLIFTYKDASMVNGVVPKDGDFSLIGRQPKFIAIKCLIEHASISFVKIHFCSN